MDKLDYWRLCTDFTVVQAALLVCGIAPEEMQWDVERSSENQCPPGYIAIRTAFRHAINAGKLKPTKTVFQCDGAGEESTYIDIYNTTVSASDIDRFLKQAGVISEFFDQFGEGVDLVSPHAATMPAKLNAAVKAWSAVSCDPARLRGKSPKQALELWLIENAADLGLLNRDGQLNRTGIEEICKVANWKPGGGATPTPTIPAPERSNGDISTKRPMIRLPPPRPSFSEELDDEIPF